MRFDQPVGQQQLLLNYPFRGRWMAKNSPTRRVPIHGSHLFGTTYAIDFVGVDEKGRSAPWGWRAAMTTEAPESFAGFGRAILAPVDGTVILVHDGESDHEARRSVPSAIPYALTQAQRARAGAAAIAGNHVVLALASDGPFVLLAHLQRGSVLVSVGESVRCGDVLSRCGNSGNSHQPHVHVQATDSIRWSDARGPPIAFVAPDGTKSLPAESQIVSV